MNCKHRKMTDTHSLFLNVLDRINLKKKDTSIASSNLSMYFTWKHIKTSYRNNKFRISAPTRNNKSLNYLIDLSLCQLLMIISITSSINKKL